MGFPISLPYDRPRGLPSSWHPPVKKKEFANWYRWPILLDDVRMKRFEIHGYVPEGAGIPLRDKSLEHPWKIYGDMKKTMEHIGEAYLQQD